MPTLPESGLLFVAEREPVLAALAAHPALLPVLLELGGGAPHLVAGGLLGAPGVPGAQQQQQNGNLDRVGAAASGQPHQEQQQQQHRVRGSYVAEAPGRCRCDDLVVLPCLHEAAEPSAAGGGPGGVLLAAGSHKAAFASPPGPLSLRAGAAVEDLAASWTGAAGAAGIGTDTGTTKLCASV
jgi:hypothetical protein